MDTPAGGTLSLRRYGASPGSHSHEHFQILLGLSGALELEIEGRGLRVGAGGGCVISPGDRHDFAAARGSLCLVLDSSDVDWARCAAASTAPPAPAWPLARYLAIALQQGRPVARAHGPALLREAWLAGASPGAPASTLATCARHRTIDWTRLERWAAQHWHDDALTVADLAAQAHLSTSQFSARCLQERGMPPMAWLRGLRQAHARLLRDTGLSVADVARRTGYRSPSALTAALRRSARR